jgi:hypothetical protein
VDRFGLGRKVEGMGARQQLEGGKCAFGTEQVVLAMRKLVFRNF